MSVVAKVSSTRRGSEGSRRGEGHGQSRRIESARDAREGVAEDATERVAFGPSEWIDAGKAGDGVDVRERGEGEREVGRVEARRGVR